MLDVFERSVEDLFAAEEERNALAHLLGLLEDVSRENDRLALPLELREEVLHEDDDHRIEAGKRLVADEHFRVVHERAEELHLLLHALAQLLGLLLEPRAKIHRIDPRREALDGRVLVDPLDRGEEEELVDDLHLPVEAALFGQVPDALLELVVHLLAEDADLARVRLRDVHDHADGRRLPGAVRAEQAECRAVRDLEVEMIDRRELAEALHDTLKRDRGRHAAFPPRWFLGGYTDGWGRSLGDAGRGPLTGLERRDLRRDAGSVMVRLPAVLACAHSSIGSERLTTDQKVAGSIPAGRPNPKPA